MVGALRSSPDRNGSPSVLPQGPGQRRPGDPWPPLPPERHHGPQRRGCGTAEDGRRHRRGLYRPRDGRGAHHEGPRCLTHRPGRPGHEHAGPRHGSPCFRCPHRGWRQALSRRGPRGLRGGRRPCKGRRDRQEDPSRRHGHPRPRRAPEYGTGGQGRDSSRCPQCHPRQRPDADGDSMGSGRQGIASSPITS